MALSRCNCKSRLLSRFACGAIVSLSLGIQLNFAATTDTSPAKDSSGQAQSIAKLIEQLGDDDFYSRQAAEEKLIELGSDVFDRLQGVQQHPDLEIAVRASYILQKLRIEWVHAEDPNDVKLLLKRYDSLSLEERKGRMDGLAAIPNAQGIGALCRIVRFEPSLQLARYAALKVISSVEASHPTTGQIAMIETELGGSLRVPAEWIKVALERVRSRSDAASNDQWFAIIDREIELLTEDSPETSQKLTSTLVDHFLEICSENPDPQLVYDVLQRRAGIANNDQSTSDSSIYFAFNWIWEHKRFDISPLLEKQYADEIEGDRLLTYFTALVRWRIEDTEAAEEIAKQAYNLTTDDVRQRSGIASVIGEMGRHDWAEREWQYVVDELPVLQSADARRWLASLRLHDRGENQQAAELLAELCTAIDENGRLKAQVLRNSALRLFFSQRDYFQACHARDEGDYDLQRKLLDSAFRYENLDADVLIAMYRSPEADEAYVNKTQQRIQKAAEELEGYLKERPEDAQSYNHWAWLISNTEGDYKKAVQYSLRSLELSPESPSFMDTLGRCYYAAGELEKAVEVQRQAVEMHPYLQVMRKQLAMFEAELAKQNASVP